MADMSTCHDPAGEPLRRKRMMTIRRTEEELVKVEACIKTQDITLQALRMRANHLEASLIQLRKELA